MVIAFPAASPERAAVDVFSRLFSARARSKLTPLFPTETLAATAVATDKADVFYADSPVAGYAISQTDGQLEALGKDVGVVKEGIAIQKNNTKMATAVQKAVQKLMDDGTYMKILKHWGVESGALDKAEINPTDLD